VLSFFGTLIWKRLGLSPSYTYRRGFPFYLFRVFFFFNASTFFVNFEASVKGVHCFRWFNGLSALPFSLMRRHFCCQRESDSIDHSVLLRPIFPVRTAGNKSPPLLVGDFSKKSCRCISSRDSLMFPFSFLPPPIGRRS